jgi:hypothetical protein
MTENKPVQIEKIHNGITQRYISIGCLVEAQDGYFYFWPRQENANKNDWYKVFQNTDLITQLYLIGSLARDDSKDFLSNEMIFIIEKNKRILISLANKYFEDFQDGLLIRQNESILDLEYGPYGPNNEKSKEVIIMDFENEEEGEYNYYYKRYYSDGAILHILDKAISWDNISDNTFISISGYDELKKDIDLLMNLLK